MAMCSIVDTTGTENRLVPIAVAISTKLYVRFWKVVEKGGGPNDGKPLPIDPENALPIIRVSREPMYRRAKHTFQSRRWRCTGNDFSGRRIGTSMRERAGVVPRSGCEMMIILYRVVTYGVASQRFDL